MESLELDMVDYSRQSELEDELSDLYDFGRYVIVGCGGIGFWVGIFLAMLGRDSFVLIDGTKIDNSNLNRLPVPQNFIGINKAIALRKIIRMLRPFAKVTCFSTNVTKENINMIFKASFQSEYTHHKDGQMFHGTFVFDTTDNAVIQNLIYKTIHEIDDRNWDVKYLKVGYEGFAIGAYNEYQVWTVKDYQPGYRTSKANVVTSALAAGIGIFKVGLGITSDLEIDFQKLIEKGVWKNGKKEKG